MTCRSDDILVSYIGYMLSKIVILIIKDQLLIVISPQYKRITHVYYSNKFHLLIKEQENKRAQSIIIRLQFEEEVNCG